MGGLDICLRYFTLYGIPMIQTDFEEIEDLLCCGMFGQGSECLGYDDEVSVDHDFEPGFLILLPDEDRVDRKTEFRLERAYSKLPREFMGYKRSLMSPVGGPRKGVIRAGEFFRRLVGTEDGYLTMEQWLRTPSYNLLEATNGEIYFDNLGLVTEIRERLKTYPEDIRLKKLAGNLLIMAQSGQYNYLRCIRHGERGAAQLAVNEFVKAAISSVFLINGAYEPYYKWVFRAFSELPRLFDLQDVLEVLLTTDNDEEMAENKYLAMEGVCKRIIRNLRMDGITKMDCDDLEKHAYSVNDMIRDSDLRNANILIGV